MPIDFPNSPTNGDTYSAGGKNWQYNGTSWVLQGVVPTIPTGSITESQLAANSVTTAKIAAGAVVEADIATGAVTAGKIDSSAVTEAKIASSAVTAGKIASNAVTHDKLHSTLSAVTICTSSTKPASPFDGQVIYMTDADQTAVWDGSAWVGIERSRDRNVIINGAMQVAQRGTSVAAISATYNTADRWGLQKTNGGTWTQSVENDAPTGSGFGKSLKWLVTTAAASPAAADILICQQNFEGQNLQQFLKGTASAKQFTVSFWVKSNVTGTYVARMVDVDNTRHVCATYSISASATWEKKTITFPADTTGAFDNDNAESLRLQWGLVVGSNFTSGTLATAWATNTPANSFVGQTNVAATLNNYWQITGVQLEAGAVATPFEFEDYSTTFQKCLRYFWRHAPSGIAYLNFIYGGSQSRLTIPFPVVMRTAPNTITATGWAGGTTPSSSNANVDAINFYAASGNFYTDTGTVITVSAEL